MAEKKQESELRQGDNRVVVEGILLEKEFIIRTDPTNGNRSISGKLTIGTNDNSEYILESFSNFITKQGKENGNAKGLQTVMDEYKSVADVGKELAERIRVTSGQLERNEYFGQDGLLKSYPKFSTNFINRLKPSEELTPQATFEVEIYIKSIVPEFKDEEETGRLIINGYIPLYGGKLVPMDFIVAEEKAVGYVESNYSAGNTVKIKGNIINSITTTKTIEEMEFGENIEHIKTTTIRELVVNGGSAPYDEEMGQAYSAEIIKKALVERETMLDEMKAKSEAKSKQGATTGTGAGGFGAKADSHEIPF